MVFALLWRYLRAAFAFAFFLCVSASQFISPFIILRYKDPANMFQVPVTPQIGGYPLLGPTGLDQVYGETNPGADRSQLTTSTGPATHENIFGDGYGGFTQNESYQPWMSPDTVVYAVRKVYKSGKYGKDLAVYNFQEWALYRISRIQEFLRDASCHTRQFFAPPISHIFVFCY